MKRTPRIGAYVLETLTTGMYVDPLDTVRELVQNASDGIRKAEETSLLKKNEGRIELVVGPHNRSLLIRDNGTGIIAEEASERLLDVGMSDKQIEHDAGFRGIGRLAGIAFCDALTFRTSAKGQTSATVIEFDCVGIRKAISPAHRRRFEMAEVLDKYASVSVEQVKNPDHFFEVKMVGIGDATTEFLDIERLETYLSQVAPVDYDPQDFLFASKIQQWLKRNRIVLPTVSLEVTTPTVRRQVFKPYRSQYRTSYQREEQYDVELTDVEFLVDDKSSDPQFWLWYGVSNFPGTVGDDRVAGFRLRKNNIALGGPERVAELFAEKAKSNQRFNAWHVGDIHILCSNAIPNGRRDGFENTGSWPKIREKLLPFVAERSSEIQKTSAARNAPVPKLVRQAEKVVGTVEARKAHGLASVEERDKLLRDVDAAKEKVETRLAQRTASNANDGHELKNCLKRLELRED